MTGESATPTDPIRWQRYLPLALMLIGALVYINSLEGQFVFDDLGGIRDNLAIKSLAPLGPLLHGSSRPMATLSFALNYAADDVNVAGYHFVNVMIHLVAAATLFGVVGRTLRSPALTDRFGTQAPWLAFAVALLWVVHPLTTQTVNYIIQRGESMMAMFYLLTVYCALRSAAAQVKYVKYLWYAGATSACVLGMGSKQVMISAPLMVLLFDRTFFAGSFAAAIRQRAGLYLSLAATWSVAAWYILRGGAVLTGGGSAGFGMPVTWIQYLLTQAQVICHYLRLSLWPHPLVFDYAWPVSSFKAAAPFGVIVVALLFATAMALWRRMAVGVAGAGFFLILAPTSSIFPIADIAVEHRMYLPLAAVVAAVVIGGYTLLVRRIGDLRRYHQVFAAVVAVIALSGALTTHARNEQYRTRTSLWRSVTQDRPSNPRGFYNLAVALRAEKEYAKALAALDNSLALMQHADPSVIMLLKYPKVYLERGNVWLELGQVNRARADLQAALNLLRKVDQDMPEVHYSLGRAKMQSGMLDEAEAHFRDALELRPRYIKAQQELAIVLDRLGRYGEAEKLFRGLIERDRPVATAYVNLAQSLLRQDRVDEAIRYLEQAMQIQDVAPQSMRRLAMLRASHVDERYRDGKQATMLAQRAIKAAGSATPRLLDTLAAAYAEQGRFDEAINICAQVIDHTEKAGLSPDHIAPVRSRLNLYRQGKPYRHDPAISEARPSRP